MFILVFSSKRPNKSYNSTSWTTRMEDSRCSLRGSMSFCSTGHFWRSLNRSAPPRILKGERSRSRRLGARARQAAWWGWFPCVCCRSAHRHPRLLQSVRTDCRTFRYRSHACALLDNHRVKHHSGFTWYIFLQ